MLKFNWIHVFANGLLVLESELVSRVIDINLLITWSEMCPEINAAHRKLQRRVKGQYKNQMRIPCFLDKTN
jgi:hypothetical protein